VSDDGGVEAGGVTHGLDVLVEPVAWPGAVSTADRRVYRPAECRLS